jgi:hypothetical protein
MALAERFAPFRPVPGIDQPARGVFLERAADGDLHVAHFSPRKVRTSHQKSIIGARCRTDLAPGRQGRQ